MTTRNKKKEKSKEKYVNFIFSDCTFKICNSISQCLGTLPMVSKTTQLLYIELVLL